MEEKLREFQVKYVTFYDGVGHRLGPSECTLTNTRLIIGDIRGGIHQILLREISGTSTPSRMGDPKTLRISLPAQAYDITFNSKDQKYAAEAWLGQAIRGSLTPALDSHPTNVAPRPHRADSNQRPHRTSRQSCGLALFILLFLAALVAGVVGVVIYSNVSKPKIPAALIPQITHTSFYQKGVLVYVRVQYSDPGHYAEGFGFVGVNGSGWAEENHSFANPSYGIPGPSRIDYPFNLGCGAGFEGASDVQFWINDTAGDRSNPVTIHIACQN